MLAGESAERASLIPLFISSVESVSRIQSEANLVSQFTPFSCVVKLLPTNNRVGVKWCGNQLPTPIKIKPLLNFQSYQVTKAPFLGREQMK